MKKLYYLFSLVVLLGFAAQAYAQTVINYPDVTDVNRVYTAAKVATAPTIDGDPTDAVWAASEWAQVQLTNDKTDWDPVDNAKLFSGKDDYFLKWKMVWTDETYHLLIYIKDDYIAYSDLHNGYDYGSHPDFVAPAGATQGDGSNYHWWRMDAIEFNMVVEEGVTDWAIATPDRNADGSCIWRNLYAGAVTSTDPGAQIMPDKNSGTVTKGTVAGAEGDDGIYIEMSDTVWAGIYPGAVLVPPAGIGVEGNVFYLDMQIGDADTDKNARDYQLFLGTTLGETRNTPPKGQWIQVTLGPLSNVAVDAVNADAGFSVYPNPNATGMLQLNKVTDGSIYTVSGQLIRTFQRTSSLDITDLRAGMYFIKDDAGNVQKLIKK